MNVETQNASHGALLDEREISLLVHRVGACLDDGRYGDLRGLYTADATARTPGGLAEGSEALVAQAARNHSRFARVQHVISDVLITFAADGDEPDVPHVADVADVRANLVVTFVADADRPGGYWQLGEVYRFSARRTDSGWRLTSVATTPIWRNGERPAASAARA